MHHGFVKACQLLLVALVTISTHATGSATARDSIIGRVEVETLPVDPAIRISSATYTPSGKVLLAYFPENAADNRDLNLAVLDDDGSNVRTFFAGRIPDRAQDNGIRYMVFPDNRRVFTGDFILECAPSLDDCERSELVPVRYPQEVAGGDHLGHRWSEIIVAPDNEHIAWTTLFANYAAAVFTGKLVKKDGAYLIDRPLVVSTVDPFRPDPKHPDGVLPNPVRNGEVKQFVRGGTAISIVGAKNSDIADSIVQDLATGDIEQITHTPGYDETTIFSPDERLGIVMTSRFSETTDLKILGLMPKPYPAALNVGLNMHAYMYAVAGVRKAREGNIGPALIDIQASRTQKDYLGINLHTEEAWAFGSPMSWHPDGKRAMWMESHHGPERKKRVQIARLPDYQPGPTVPARPTPQDIHYATEDLSVIRSLLKASKDADVKVYGRASGHIHYTRDDRGRIEKVYREYSDDGAGVYNGVETMAVNPDGYSTYIADIRLTGPRPGRMDLQITFGPLDDPLPARIVFDNDVKGNPLTLGYTEFDGQRLEITRLAE